MHRHAPKDTGNADLDPLPDSISSPDVNRVRLAAITSLCRGSRIAASTRHGFHDCHPAQPDPRQPTIRLPSQAYIYHHHQSGLQQQYVGFLSLQSQAWIFYTDHEKVSLMEHLRRHQTAQVHVLSSNATFRMPPTECHIPNVNHYMLLSAAKCPDSPTAQYHQMLRLVAKCSMVPPGHLVVVSLPPRLVFCETTSSSLSADSKV